MCVNVCVKGYPILLVTTEYTKVLRILVKITEPKKIFAHHEVWAL